MPLLKAAATPMPEALPAPKPDDPEPPAKRLAPRLNIPPTPIPAACPLPPPPPPLPPALPPPPPPPPPPSLTAN